MGLDADRAALGHGVARIDREVENRLVELRGVDLDRPQAGIGMQLHDHLLAQGPAQHAGDLRQALVEVDHRRLQRLLAREGEQPARQLGAAQRAVQRFLDDLALPRVGLLHRDVEIADDDAEQVVEVVRDAAGQLADRLHLHRLAQLLLDRLALGDVLGVAEQIFRIAGLVLDRHLDGAQQALALVAGGDRLFRRDLDLAGLQHGAILGDEMVGLVPGEEIVVALAEILAAAVAEQLLARAVEQHEAAVGERLHEQHARQVVDHRVEEAGGLLQLLDHVLLVAHMLDAGVRLLLQAHDLGHVLDPVDDPRDLAGLVQDRRIERRPIALLEAAAFGVRPADVVFLHRHRVRAAELQHAHQRGAQVVDPGRGGIVRIVREHVEQAAPQDAGALGLGGAAIGIADRDDGKVRRQHEVEVGRRFEQRAEIGQQRRLVVHCGAVSHPRAAHRIYNESAPEWLIDAETSSNGIGGGARCPNGIAQTSLGSARVVS